ncbi:MAG: tRNA epoxyqueuosine(34) reductase QueG [Burkholderiales bacterium]|jgi:epoxyqueuosine reductase|nr:tRNA epoxyqueuosine(34) reductase QueG [Burkholderiales bacterium]
MDTCTFSWEQLKQWAHSLGLDAVGITDTDLGHCEPKLQQWLDEGRHGSMHYMARHGMKRARPDSLVEACVRVVSVRLNYLAEQTTQDTAESLPDDWRDSAWRTIEQSDQGYVSLYARGRDYHKVLRKKLQKLADLMVQNIGPMGYRVFVDSAPVLEVALAEKAGLGWRGKHTLLINRDAGSMFFLGEILTDYPFETSAATTAHCGQCTACIDICPTQAIVAPYWLDARRCISYLTIEHEGAIPLEFREAIGNRIYGCDDCQLICPWNKFAKTSPLPDFKERDAIRPQALLAFLKWTEDEFLEYTEGSAIRRIGHARWQRNVVIAIGNGAPTVEAIDALRACLPGASALLAEHVGWALGRLGEKA